MLLHGDELGRTQDGNNNTYAQDSEIAWMHWDHADKPLIEFTAAVAKLRASHPTFHRKRFFTGNTVRTGDGERLNDIVWLGLDGEPMEDDDWDGGAKAIGMYLNGDGIAGKDARGGTHHRRPLPALLQRRRPGRRDPAAARSTPPRGTSSSTPAAPPTPPRTLEAGATLALTTRSLVVLREHAEAEQEPDHSVAASLAVAGRRRRRATARPRPTSGTA